MRTSRLIIILGWASIVFMTAPVALVVYLSFIDDNFITVQASGYSFRWFVEVFERGQMRQGILYSLLVASLATVISVTLGVPAALGLSRSRMRGKRILENVFILPLVIPAIVVGVSVFVFFHRAGEILGTRIVPGLWTLVLAHVLITLPWAFRLIYAGMLSISPQVERASIDLGANRWQTLRHVVLPLLRPAILGAAILSFVFSFSNLEISIFLVDSGQSTLPVAMVQYAKFRVDPSIAAVSTIQIVIVGVMLLLANRLLNFGTTFTGGTKG